MKTTKLIILTMALGLMGVGCAKSNSQGNGGNNNTTTTYVPPVIIDPNAPTTPVTPGSTVGANATFTPVNLQTMNEYVATHPLNNPTNYKVNVNLSQASAGRYGGDITISYYDNGIQYDGVFKSGLGTNQSFNGMYDNGKLQSEYNYWFNLGTELVFTGFFEDQYGSITISLQPEATTAGHDAEPLSGTYRGSIYFKNFTVARYETYWFQTYGGSPTSSQSPYRSCWFIYTGPYDCRSNQIQSKGSLAPGPETTYKLLGTFTGLDIKKGFNIQ